MSYKLEGYKIIDIFNKSEIELILHTIFSQIKISIIESINKQFVDTRVIINNLAKDINNMKTRISPFETDRETDYAFVE